MFYKRKRYVVIVCLLLVVIVGLLMGGWKYREVFSWLQQHPTTHIHTKANLAASAASLHELTGESLARLNDLLQGSDILTDPKIAPMQFGAWLGATPSAALIAAFEADSGRHMDIVHWYMRWPQPFSDVQPYVDIVYQSGGIAMLTWQPDSNTVEIANGSYDGYITQFADEVRDYGHPVLLRPMHEMNGNWDPWNIGDSPVNTDQTYIQAWDRIVHIFRQRGAFNAKFVWCINEHSFGKGASFMGAYPGDANVDYVGIDGYNWGTRRHDTRWRTFSEIFTPGYTAITERTMKPILIAEFGSTELGGSKAQWITDAFEDIASGKFRRIQALVWFNENKETDWRIESSSAAQQAFSSKILAAK